MSDTRLETTPVPIASAAEMKIEIQLNAAANAASVAPMFRRRCAGRSTNRIGFPCSSVMS
jgi:hypothetical protein